MDAQKGSFGRVAALLVPALSGLVASALLLVDYVRPAPVFCDVDGGCAQLRHTVYASWLGVPTPVFGVVGFVAIGLLALQRGPRVRLALAVVATVAALVAALFLSVQARFGVWCKFCVVADTSALVACAVAWWRQRAGWDPPDAVRARLVVGLGTIAPALCVPIAIGAAKKPEIPAPIARELAASPPGALTVVDFVDFECPFCRMTHAELAPVLASHADRVRVVRRQVPLERIHPHALVAAEAACCGEAMGKGDAMADALFTAPVDDLTEDGCAQLAASLGLDAEAFRKCMQDPGTLAKIRADQSEFKAARGRGLPTLWIGEEKIEGTRPREDLERAVARGIAQRT